MELEERKKSERNIQKKRELERIKLGQEQVRLDRGLRTK